MKTKTLEDRVLKRSVEEFERRLTWVELREQLVESVCRAEVDEYDGEIRMRPDPWGRESKLWQRRSPKRSLEEVLEAFGREPDFGGEVEGDPDGDETDELLAGLTLAGFLDADHINPETQCRLDPSTWVRTLASLVGLASLDARLGVLTRLAPTAPLLRSGAIAPLGRELFGGVEEFVQNPLVPRVQAWAFGARLLERPARVLPLPSLTSIAPWLKPKDEGWDDAELLASSLRDLALLMSVRGAQEELDRELAYYDREGRDYTEGEKHERLDVFTRRLEAARAERAERMAKAKAPLGLSRLIREYDLNAMEVEILLVVACLDLLGSDSQTLRDWRLYVSSNGGWSSYPGSVEGLSALFGRDRSERMAVRELVGPGSRLVRAGLLHFNGLSTEEGDLVDPSSTLALTWKAAAVLSGVEGLRTLER